MMTELGFGLVGLGFISALSSFVGQGLQVIYGFLAAFFKRTTMLAIGNVVVGLTEMLQYFIGSYPQLVAARVAMMPAPVRSIRSARAFSRATIPKLAAGRSRFITRRAVSDRSSDRRRRHSRFFTWAGAALS